MSQTATQQLDPVLRDKVRILGSLLGQTIGDQYGASMLKQIEQIRKQDKKARSGASAERDILLQLLQNLPDKSLVPVVRGFNQFLDLANIAEQQHSVSWRRQTTGTDDTDAMFSPLLDRLQQQGIDGAALSERTAAANNELVFTAHPTEITRRTLIQKYDNIARLLQQRDDLRDDHPQLAALEQQLGELIDEIWHTDEIRQVRPTAVDEAKWGFAV